MIARGCLSLAYGGSPPRHDLDSLTSLLDRRVRVRTTRSSLHARRGRSEPDTLGVTLSNAAAVPDSALTLINDCHKGLLLWLTLCRGEENFCLEISNHQYVLGSRQLGPVQPQLIYLAYDMCEGPSRMLRRNSAMAVTVKKAVLWRKEIDSRPGILANTLEPLSDAGADLQVVMAYRYPGGKNMAAVELHPVPAGSLQRRQRQRVSPGHRSPPCWSRGIIGRAWPCPHESDR